MKELCRQKNAITAELLKKLLLSNLTEDVKSAMIKWWFMDADHTDQDVASLNIVCYEITIGDEAFRSGLIECHLELTILGSIE